jgi:hypothetical protein
MRQLDLARAADVSQSAVSRAERGHLDSLSVRTVRALFAAVDARFEGEVRWRGGELDHLLDKAHASLGTRVVQQLAEAGWTVIPEVTFMRFGERGSIDLLGVRPDIRAATAFELKSELTSYEQMQRRLDVKGRVAGSVVEERFGWRPASLGLVLVLRDTTANRARVGQIVPLIRSALPAGSREVRRWLANPDGRMAGIWFVRDSRRGTGKCKPASSHRVRRPRRDDE